MTGLALLGATLGAPLAGAAAAHGSTQNPASRVYACRFESPDNAMCAEAWSANSQALYDWMEVNIGDAGGRHRELIPDGRLCSAGRQKYGAFDRPGPWPVTALHPDESGHVELVYENTAPHSTEYYRAYITRAGFDARVDALTWADLELAFDSGRLDRAPQHRMRARLPRRDVPAILYIVWQRSDSPEAFYACSDVTVGRSTDGATTTSTSTLPTTTLSTVTSTSVISTTVVSTTVTPTTVTSPATSRPTTTTPSTATSTTMSRPPTTTTTRPTTSPSIPAPPSTGSSTAATQPSAATSTIAAPTTGTPSTSAPESTAGTTAPSPPAQTTATAPGSSTAEAPAAPAIASGSNDSAPPTRGGESAPANLAAVSDDVSGLAMQALPAADPDGGHDRRARFLLGAIALVFAGFVLLGVRLRWSG